MGYQEPRTDKKEAEGYERFAKFPQSTTKRSSRRLMVASWQSMGTTASTDDITFIDPKPKVLHLCALQRR